MPHPQIIVFGEALVDQFADHDVIGGAPCNVARHLAALGLDPLFISAVGDDALGAQLRADFARFGLRSDGVVKVSGRPTGRVQVHAEAGGGHRFEILADQAYDHITASLPADVAAACGRTGQLPWIYCGTLAQRNDASREALLGLLHRLPHRAFVDINWRAGHVSPELVQATIDRADALKLSAEELELVLGWQGLSSLHTRQRPRAGDHCAGVQALLGGGRARVLLVTHGGDGFAYWDHEGRCQHAGAASTPARIADTVGAGDAFSSISLAGMVLGWPVEDTLQRAAQFAAAICSLQGAVPADMGFYAQWKRQWGLAS
jgi:fructokinase